MIFMKLLAFKTVREHLKSEDLKKTLDSLEMGYDGVFYIEDSGGLSYLYNGVDAPHESHLPALKAQAREMTLNHHQQLLSDAKEWVKGTVERSLYKDRILLLKGGGYVSCSYASLIEAGDTIAVSTRNSRRTTIALKDAVDGESFAVRGTSVPPIPFSGSLKMYDVKGRTIFRREMSESGVVRNGHFTPDSQNLTPVPGVFTGVKKEGQFYVWQRNGGEWLSFYNKDRILPYGWEKMRPEEIISVANNAT